ncbi:MAG TPA: HAD family hydrolase [Streptosporangiaceae bacterium]|nr:HAD family hydrolase [Streptosporangiaceae bacterium]
MTGDISLAARERLRAARGFILDLDGTLVLTDRRNTGYTPLPGAVDLTHWLAARHVPFVTFTNGTTKTPHAYAQALAEAGFSLNEESVLTPAVSAAEMFARRGYRRVMALGNDGLTGPLRAAGIEVVPPVRGQAADAVLAGWYPEFTLDDLEAGCDAVWRGAGLFSCSQSVFFATADGKAIGTSRAISAMIRSITGCRVEIVGKPSLHALRSACRRLRVRPAQLAVVGDDPDLEIPMAHRGRALAVAVGTGIGTATSFASVRGGRGPHLTLTGVDELLALCRELAQPGGGTHPFHDRGDFSVLGTEKSRRS